MIGPLAWALMAEERSLGQSGVACRPKTRPQHLERTLISFLQSVACLKICCSWPRIDIEIGAVFFRFHELINSASKPRFPRHERVALVSGVINAKTEQATCSVFEHVSPLTLACCERNKRASEEKSSSCLPDCWQVTDTYLETRARKLCHKLDYRPRFESSCSVSSLQKAGVLHFRPALQNWVIQISPVPQG